MCDVLKLLHRSTISNSKHSGERQPIDISVWGSCFTFGISRSASSQAAWRSRSRTSSGHRRATMLIEIATDTDRPVLCTCTTSSSNIPIWRNDTERIAIPLWHRNATWLCALEPFALLDIWRNGPAVRSQYYNAHLQRRTTRRYTIALRVLLGRCLRRYLSEASKITLYIHHPSVGVTDLFDFPWVAHDKQAKRVTFTCVRFPRCRRQFCKVHWGSSVVRRVRFRCLTFCREA